MKKIKAARLHDQKKKNLTLKNFTGHFTRLKSYVLLISKQIPHASEAE